MTRIQTRIALFFTMLCAFLGALPNVAASQALFADSAGVKALKDAARIQSPDLLSRRAAVDVARARAAGTGFSPPATLGTELEEIPGGLNVPRAGSLRLDLSREFVSRDLRAARRAVAERDVERAQAELESAERGIGASVDRALTVVVGATAIARRLAAEDSLLASAEEGVRSRFAVGEARYVDVLRLRTERLRVRTEAAAAQTDARIARRQLDVLFAPRTALADLGATVDTIVVRELRDPLRTPLPPPPSPDSLLALSSAALFGDVDVARAQALRRVARAGQRPAFTASVGLQRFSAENGHFSIGPTAGASVSLPFTARRANRALLASAESEVNAAEARRYAALAAVRSKLAAAHERYEAARERFRLFDAALLQGARAERESALAAYRSGELSLLELLDFERALARAEIARIRSRIDAADAFADLIAGAGGTEHGEPLAPAIPAEDDR